MAATFPTNLNISTVHISLPSSYLWQLNCFLRFLCICPTGNINPALLERETLIGVMWTARLPDIVKLLSQICN